MHTNWSRVCLQSTSGRGYKDPEVGSVPNTDFFSDSLVCWFLRMCSSVMVFFVARSMASLTSVPLSRASQRTLPTREVTNLEHTVAKRNVQVLQDDDGPASDPRLAAPLAIAICDVMVAAAIARLHPI